MTRFRFHLLGLPHTATNRNYFACAYTQKLVKFIDMMAPRGHEIVHYGGESSLVVPDPTAREPVGRLCDHVTILTEEERQSFFGPHDPQKLYDLSWSSSSPYWELANERMIRELKRRARKGDFILSLAGNCQKPIADAFDGSAAGTVVGPCFVEFGIGYYGTFSRYRVYESHAHREWCMGRKDNTWEDNDTAVVPNYFDLRDFEIDPVVESRLEEVWGGTPYLLYIGRLITEKGIDIACDTSEQAGLRLVIAGQGGVAVLDPDVTYFGAANPEERAVLMKHAVAVMAPTHYREPFGGVAVEAQLCGTPAITTDHGAFVETVAPSFRAASHRGFCNAVDVARGLLPWQRANLKRAAEMTWSLEAIAPLYEDYFQRLTDRWGAGWYQIDPLPADTADANAALAV